MDCAIDVVGGHQVLHRSGPQVSSAQPDDDSAQFFTFQATMPSPTMITSYGAVGEPNGIHVNQLVNAPSTYFVGSYQGVLIRKRMTSAPSR